MRDVVLSMRSTKEPRTKVEDSRCNQSRNDCRYDTSRHLPHLHDRCPNSKSQHHSRFLAKWKRTEYPKTEDREHS